MPDPALIVRFLDALGAHDPVVGAKWVTCQCPLAPFQHKKGTDTKPSFGVNIESGLFNCFTCQSGSLEKLLQALELYTSKSGFEGWQAKYHFDIARDVLNGIENSTIPLPDYEAAGAKAAEFIEWPEYWVSLHVPWRESARAAWYLLTGRAQAKSGEEPNQPVDPAIADAMGLLYDSGHDKIIAPYRNVFGKLAGARGRAIDPASGFQHYDYTWNKVNNAALVWYNEPCLDKAIEAHRPVVVVEGQFDCMNVQRVYPYVVANLTAKPSEEKIRKLNYADAVILMLDNDDTGRTAAKKYLESLKVPVGQIEYPGKDPAKLTLEQMNGLFEGL